jgi:hypothetical protein
MLKRVIIDKQYVKRLIEIDYLGESDTTADTDGLQNHGHRFRFLKQTEEKKPLISDTLEVVGWIEQTIDCPYDFIVKDSIANRYYLAVLGQREDGWPLFSVQNEGYICARSRMGSEWNCRYCYKFFGETCKRI